MSDTQGQRGGEVMPGAAGSRATQRGGALGKVKPEQQKHPETSAGAVCTHTHSLQSIRAGLNSHHVSSDRRGGNLEQASPLPVALPGNVPPGPQSRSCCRLLHTDFLFNLCTDFLFNLCTDRFIFVSKKELQGQQGLPIHCRDSPDFMLLPHTQGGVHQ